MKQLGLGQARKTGFFVTLILCLCLSSSALSDPDSFWTIETETWGKRNRRHYRAASRDLASQGMVVQTEIVGARAFTRLEMLSQLREETKDLVVLGQKDAVWNGEEAHLVAFRGRRGEKRVLGRLVYSSNEKGAQMLLLLTSPRSDLSLFRNFESQRENWPGFHQSL